MIDLLIDRVGNVNVFNVLQSDSPAAESHLQSTMDEDLILEFIKEVENLAKVSISLSGKKSSESVITPDILKELKILGETFFEQFFPPAIAEKLKLTTKKNLHFRIDPALSVIPWELLHDGTCFLSDKFFIGKTVRGELSVQENRDREKLKMLIIADPTEDLKWAEKEGEELFKVLKQKVPASRLDIEFIGGKQITKLKLLSLIRGKNIIHYSGHLFFSEDPLENGWLLSNDKILRAREIKNSGFSTDLVFSNSCQSSKSAENRLNSNIMNYFAGSFLMSGIKCFIGTNWETPDNKNTLDFTIRFYTSLFSDKSVGEALFISKEFARRNYDTSDLTWANYSLHGTPNYTILNDGGTEKSAQKIINPSLIFNFYPTPIAKSYNEFIQKEKEERDLPVRMSTLIYSFEEFSKILGAIIFSDHKFHAMGRDLPENPDDAIELKDWWNLIYACLWDFKKMEISPLVASFTDVLHANREVLQKIIGWVELFNSDMIDPGTMEGYLVTYQYYYENLLMELGEFESTDVFLISENSNNHYFFKGMKPSVSLITAPMIKQDYVGNQIEKYRGKLVVFNQNRKTLIPLITGSMIDNTVTGELELWFPGFLTSRIIKMPSA